MELIQLLLKFFNLELKDNNPMDISPKTKATRHEIDATSLNVDLPLTAFNEALYSTYSPYLESLQASSQLKYLKFNTPVDKILEWEKAFRKNIVHPTREIVCLA